MHCRTNLGAALRGSRLGSFPNRTPRPWQNAASSTTRQYGSLRDVFIADGARTPIGSFCGSLADVPAPQLAAEAISAALGRARVEPGEVDAIVFGQALPSGCGQNPVRQAALLAEIPEVVDCTGINKACASGLKAITVAAQAIALGHADVIVAGGMESMSRAPYLMKQARFGGYQYGHGRLEDSALQDGLWDVANDCHMGVLAETIAQELGITRQDQDIYTRVSYERAAEAWQRGAMDKEVTPIRLRQPRRHDPMTPATLAIGTDEEYSRLKIDTIASLRPVFREDGTIIAASASSLNDGAAAVVLISGESARELGIATNARILSYSDHAMQSVDFAKAASGAVKRAMHLAKLSHVDFHETHEAFAVSALTTMQLLDLDISRVNLNGGAVALGHPLGASGARLMCSIMNVLEQQGATTGCASIANGGGGATAVVIERD